MNEVKILTPLQKSRRQYAIKKNLLRRSISLTKSFATRIKENAHKENLTIEQYLTILVEKDEYY